MSEVLRQRRILANQPSAESPSSNSESTPPPTASASPPESSTSSPPPPPEESSPPPPSPPPPSPPPSKSKSTPSPPQQDESQQSSPSPSSATSPPSTTTSPPPPSTTSPSPPSTTTPSSSTTPPSPSSSNQSPSPPTPTSSSSQESPTTNTGNTSQQSSPVPPNPASEQQIPQIPEAVTRSPPLIQSLPISSSSTNQGTTTPVLSPPSTGSKAPPPPPTTQASDNSSQHGIPLGAAVGATIGFVCVVAFFLIICAARRRKKRRDQYIIPQQNPKFHSGGYQIATQQGPVVHSGSSESGYIYNSQIYSSGGSESGVNNHPPEMFGGSKSYFSYEEMMEMTRGFSQQNILGEGGFGCVYKGWLPDGKPVAVKQLKAGSGQGEREFKAEVEIISRVHHRHLVSLVGYCIADQHRLLIYEFVPNKTLEHHLHSTRGKVLEWTKRVKIALGSAKGLAYLHEDCEYYLNPPQTPPQVSCGTRDRIITLRRHPKIIHRDIKSANILIDDAFEAQVADFGLARLSDATQTHVSTRVMGTFGYLAPEYAASGKLTDRSDVYSFGVVILELITGKKPVDPNRPLGDESLVEWARPLLIQAIESGDLSEIVDPRLEKQYVEREMFRMIEVAAACVRHSASKRPRMAQVVRALDMDGELTDLSNGVKFGQSTAYDSRQYSQDISRFRQLALGSDTSSEYNLQSGDYSTRGFTSSDSETRAINRTNRESS